MSAEVFFVRLHQSFADSKDLLNTLDAAIGDGDHGSTMLRGLTAAIAADDGRRAKAFMRASGGASGTLFGLILVGIEAHFEEFPMHEHREENRDDLSVRLAERLETALERICDLGEVKPGDKSLVDALAPAVAALKTEGLGSAISAASSGRDATKAMVARRGRAQYVEAGGKGHIDPGAVSVVMFLQAVETVTET